MAADPKPAERERDPEYLRRVKLLKCCVHEDWRLGFPAPGDCDGVIEAAHVGPSGVARKSDDREAIPLCSYHHARLDNCLNGSLFQGRHVDIDGVSTFVGMDLSQAKVAKLAWVADQINRTQTTVKELELQESILIREPIPF